MLTDGEQVMVLGRVVRKLDHVLDLRKVGASDEREPGYEVELPHDQFVALQANVILHGRKLILDVPLEWQDEEVKRLGSELAAMMAAGQMFVLLSPGRHVPRERWPALRQAATDAVAEFVAAEGSVG